MTTAQRAAILGGVAWLPIQFSQSASQSLVEIPARTASRINANRLLRDLGTEREVWRIDLALDEQAAPAGPEASLRIDGSLDGQAWKPLGGFVNWSGPRLRLDVPPVRVRWVRVRVVPARLAGAVRAVQVNSDALALPDRIRLFDSENVRLFNGEGYSNQSTGRTYLTGAHFAWTESYLQRAYAEMYRATGDPKYVTSLRDHIRRILAQRDDRMGRRDFQGTLLPLWGTDYFSPVDRWEYFAVHQGMIGIPMLEYIQLTRESEDPAVRADHAAILSTLEEILGFLEADWNAAGGFYYAPSRYGHVPSEELPLDMQSALGSCLILLYDLTGKEAYRTRAAALLSLIESSFRHLPDGTLILPVVEWHDPHPGRRHVGDTPHASVIFHFLLLAHQYGYPVTQGTPEHLAATVSHWLESGRQSLWMDGSGELGSDLFAGHFGLLAPWSLVLRDRIEHVLFGTMALPTTVSVCAEGNWGVSMLDLASDIRQRLTLAGAPFPDEQLPISTDSAPRAP